MLILSANIAYKSVQFGICPIGFVAGYPLLYTTVVIVVSHTKTIVTFSCSVEYQVSRKLPSSVSYTPQCASTIVSNTSPTVNVRVMQILIFTGDHGYRTKYLVNP